MLDIQRTDIVLLFLAFVFTVICILSSWVLSLKIAPTDDPDETFVAAEYLAHWAAVNTCHVFAVSPFTLGKLITLFIITKSGHFVLSLAFALE